MSRARLCSRLTKLEAQRRPFVVADILRRARQCAPSAVGMFLDHALRAVDPATAGAIMDQLTDAELEALLGPEQTATINALSEAELEALARGDPAVTRQVQRAPREASQPSA